MNIGMVADRSGVPPKSIRDYESIGRIDPADRRPNGCRGYSQHIEALDQKIEELRSMRKALAELVRHCRGDLHPDCPILDDFDEGK